MIPYLDFIKKHWRLTAEVVGALACIMVGFYLVPKPDVTVKEKIVTQVQVKEVKVVDTQLVEQEVTRRVAEFEKTLNTHTVTVVVTRKDGSKVEKTTQDTSSDTKSKVDDSQLKQQVVTVHDVQTVEVEKVVTKEVQVEVKSPQPNWAIGVSANLSLVPKQGTWVPQPGVIYVGPEVSRRIIGPFFLGVNVAVGLNPAGGGVEGGQVGLRVFGVL